jgi:hypothetical protein
MYSISSQLGDFSRGKIFGGQETTHLQEQVMILLQVEGFSIDENFECAFYTFLRSNQEQYGPS